ncbi:hypothetical protein [Celeribacter persicus]|nr:hypothetical protein [Celeribacter persicus]
MQIHRLKSRILACKRNRHEKRVFAALSLQFAFSGSENIKRTSMLQSVSCSYESDLTWQQIRTRLIEKGWQQIDAYFAAEDHTEENIFSPEPFLTVLPSEETEHQNKLRALLRSRIYNRLMWQYIFIFFCAGLGLLALNWVVPHPKILVIATLLLCLPILGLHWLKTITLKQV